MAAQPATEVGVLFLGNARVGKSYLVNLLADWARGVDFDDWE